MGSISSLCVFCGSSMGASPQYRQAARDFGTALARRGIALVYGGSAAGLMGITARSVLEHNGRVTGIITRDLYRRTENLEVSNPVIVDTMHERKAAMYESSDAFIALPGGIGTLEELLESFTWNQLGIHSKPVGVLNINDFFTPLLILLDHLVTEGFLKPEHRQDLVSSSCPEELLDTAASQQHRYRPKRQ